MITVARLLHSPIKGLEFVDCAEVVVGPAGAEFDRRFFLVNADGRLVNSVRHGRLCLARAEYDGETLTVYLPDGTVVAAPDPARGEPIELAWEAGHHVSGHVVEGPWAEALAEFAGEPVRLARIEDGRGGWSGSAVSLLGDASIAALGKGPLDPRRFRMGVLLTGGTPFAEDAWIGSDIAIGSTLLAVRAACPRCVVTTRDPTTGERDLDAVRAMIDVRGVNDLGIYCDVLEAGRIAVGDAVSVIRPSAAVA